MKLFAKIALCTIGVLVFSVSITGYCLISDSFSNALEGEEQRASDEYLLLKYSLQSSILAASSSQNLNDTALISLAKRTIEAAPSNNWTAVIDASSEVLYSTFPSGYNFSQIEKINESELRLFIDNEDNNIWIVIYGRVSQDECNVFLVSARNATRIITENRSMQVRYIWIYIIVLAGGISLTLILSTFLTRPIKQLMKSTRRIANGKFSERVQISSSDEIGELTYYFNRMTEKIEVTVRELECIAQQKEDFVANFAHELKTPLTSVIGYADMIYQNRALSPQEVHDAAGYIVNEGMRLESLSLKLMELIVLNKNDFALSFMPTDGIFQDIADTLRPVMNKKNVYFSVSAEPAYIKVEYDLFKTLILNLLDNATKADSTQIILTGKIDKPAYYTIYVTDNGRGIPESVLPRITEAFYMVDKSRSRRQHGIGLGLAIVARIATLHNADLHFDSKLGKGTTVRIQLPLEDE